MLLTQVMQMHYLVLILGLFALASAQSSCGGNLLTDCALTQPVPTCPGCDGWPGPTAPTPVCVEANSSAVENLASFYPYCGQMLTSLAAAGRPVFLPDDPSNLYGYWEPAFKPALVQYLSGAASITRVLGSAGSTGASVACTNAFIQLTCQTAFPPCASSDTLPSAPSFGVCNALYAAPDCVALINGTALQGGASVEEVAIFFAPDCSSCESGCISAGSSPYKFGQPRFPVTNQTWTIPGPPPSAVSVPSTALPGNLFDQTGQWPCYFPWANCPPGVDCYCAPQCPDALQTPTEYNNCATMVAIVGWFSYFSTFFVFCTMVLLSRYRHFPANLIIFVLLNSHIAAFGFIFSATRGWERTVCADAITPAGQDTGSGACVFNGLTILFGGLATTFFWAAVAINSFIAIYLKRDSILRSVWFEIATHVVCWGFPVTACIIGLAVQKIGAPTDLIVCFVQDSDGPFSWEYVLFFAPVGLCLLVSSFAIVLVLWEMRNLRAATGSSRFSKHIRIAIFLVVFLGIYAFIFAFRFTAVSGSSEWGAAYVVWLEANIWGPVQAAPTSGPSYGLFMAFHFFVGVQGVLIAILFGSNSDVLSFWVERFKNVREGRSFFSGITSYTSSSKVGGSSVRTTGPEADAVTQ